MQNILGLKKKTLILLGIIFVLGIFLRTYNFHDGLRFNADQARDATLVAKVVDEGMSWPLLGPKAGGTDFRLGPIFYEFQIISGKIFGSYPDKLAYPDLFFSLLSIPLFFFLLRKYFNQKLALLLTALYAVSFYAIKYAHFAWNPNSTPFWTMLFLYALLQIVEYQGVRRIFWSIVAGVAVGVEVQLHTFLLIIIPILMIVYFIQNGIADKKLWRSFLVILVVSIFINIPQIYNEVKTNGSNAQAFFSEVADSKKDRPFLGKVVRNTECFMTVNAFTISSMGASDQCDFLPVKTISDMWDVIFGGIIFLGGIGLSIWQLRKVQDATKKRFLQLMLTYTGMLFVLMIPVSYELSLRYFLIISFLPFVLLGLWMEFLTQKYKNIGWTISMVLGVILISLNLWTDKNALSDIANYTSIEDMSGFDNVHLGELEQMADYIVAQKDLSSIVLLDGNSRYLFKASKGLIYLTGRKGIELEVLKSKSSLPDVIVFNLISTESKDRKIKALKEDAGVSILDFKSFGRFSLIKYQITSHTQFRALE